MTNKRTTSLNGIDLSRRQSIAAAAGILAVAIAPTLVMSSDAKAAEPHPDAELLDISQQIEAIWTRRDELWAAYMETDAEAERLGRDVPPALIRTGADYINFGGGKIGWAWLPHQVDELKLLSDPDLSDSMGRAAVRQNARINELRQLADWHYGRIAAFNEESGRNANEAEFDDLHEQSAVLEERAMALTPRTVEGFLALAAIAKRCNSRYWDDPVDEDEEVSFEDRWFRLLIDNAKAVLRPATGVVDV